MTRMRNWQIPTAAAVAACALIGTAGIADAAKMTLNVDVALNSLNQDVKNVLVSCSVYASTEAAILTTERLVYHNGGKSTAIPLSDITDIRHRKDAMIGDIIEIDSRSGMPMKIEISLFNQGETFLNALRNAWERSK